ncbi:hypothetical protein [Parasitella parasitica]|uniref:Retrotransposon gag domain-containing protein n=1 Tax=Parasitella parasitica TaxID=35722 RepID=A0A0B7NQT0_9FUNG|nr:hypothetical protein [Parasitella parasitica]
MEVNIQATTPTNKLIKLTKRHKSAANDVEHVTISEGLKQIPILMPLDKQKRNDVQAFVSLFNAPIYKKLFSKERQRRLGKPESRHRAKQLQLVQGLQQFEVALPVHEGLESPLLLSSLGISEDGPLPTNGHGVNNSPLPTNGHGHGDHLSNGAQVSGENVILTRNEQLAMLEKVNNLKKQLYLEAKEAMVNPDNSQAATKASFNFRQVEAMQKYYDFLFADSSVPSDTPYFQWKGHKFMSKKYVFRNVDMCLTQLENVLESRSMDVETHWKRIIKARMSTGMANWAKEILKSNSLLTWGQFKVLLKAKYSGSGAEERMAAVNMMKNLKLSAFQSIEAYLEAFNNLKEQAGATEDTLLVDHLLKGLDHEMYQGLDYIRDKNQRYC